MDFMKWLNSLDEFLYEVMSWLLFFPLTVWKSIVRPFQTMAVVECQAALPEEQQYAELLSPPLYLTLSLLLSHGVATALGQTDAIVDNRHGLASLIDDATTALMLRVIVFSGFPLFLAARSLRREGVALNRLTLQRPFYEQCYPGAVLALGLSLGTSLVATGAHWGRLAGLAWIVGSLLHFFIVETHWFALRGPGGHLRAAASVLVGVFEGALFLLIIGFVFTR